jgi:hypothetical protein
LRGDGHFVRARHARRTPASQLPGTETSENRELERGELSWAVYHREPLLRGVTSQVRPENEERVEEQTQACPVDMQPPPQGFGEGWAGLA